MQSTIEQTIRYRLRHSYQGTGGYRYAVSENDTVPFNDFFSESLDSMQTQVKA